MVGGSAVEPPGRATPVVQLDLGADDHDRLISPEERYRIAMTRQ